MFFLSLLSMALVDRDKTLSRGREPVAMWLPALNAEYPELLGVRKFVTATSPPQEEGLCPLLFPRHMGFMKVH